MLKVESFARKRLGYFWVESDALSPPMGDALIRRMADDGRCPESVEGRRPEPPAGGPKG